ncbi:MAG: HzsA-related protein, partial [Planctomycetota bacterium]
EPTSYGGTFTLERILGTVPVEEDGSARFEVPANRTLFLIALDHQGRAVKRMQSFLSVMPGEETSCVGCHDNRRTAPGSVQAGQLQAMKRRPSRISPVPGIPDVIDYPRDVQPILDKHCVECHRPERREGGIILTGDHGPVYSHSYYTLSATYQFSDGRNLPKSNYPPYALGDAASPIMKMLRGEHYNVRLSRHEVEMVRHWIHCGAPYIGTYAALIGGMIGSTGYEASHFTAIDTRILKSKNVQSASRAIERRCDGCHVGVRTVPKHPADWGQGTKLIQPQRAWMIKQTDNRAVWRFQQHILYNLAHPEQSVQLLAPLAREAGGYGACRQISRAGTGRETITDQVASVFASKDDPDYQALLAAILDAKALHDSDPRWDTLGWKPPVEYVREMKRHGILPETFDRETDPLDPYDTDRRYWHAVTGHHLPGTEPKLHANPTIRALCLEGAMAPDGNEFKPGAASLTTGKPVTCSTAIAQYPAHFANDGRAGDTNRFWGMDVAGGDPAWWQVDLEEPIDVGRIVVVGYYGDDRYYGFTVETSLDGNTWEMVADRRDNKAPSTAGGYTCRFKQRKVRYIRVTQTSNSANSGRHLVEVMAHEE